MNVRSDASAAGDPCALSPTEHALALLWCEVLQTEKLPCASDDFFELGGDSMTMVLLESRIKEELSISLPAGVMLSASTLSSLARLIDSGDSLLTRGGALPPNTGV